jgi:ERCC4-type nuclease
MASLGALRDESPTLVIDTREQDPLEFKEFDSIRATLTTGDYSIRTAENRFAVERKSIPDLIGSLGGPNGENRERLFREMHRLRGFDFGRFLVVGSEQDIIDFPYKAPAKMNANVVLGSLRSIDVGYVPVVFAPTPEAAAKLIEDWAWTYVRSQVGRVNDFLSAAKAMKAQTP